MLKLSKVLLFLKLFVSYIFLTNHSLSFSIREHTVDRFFVSWPNNSINRPRLTEAIMGFLLREGKSLKHCRQTGSHPYVHPIVIPLYQEIFQSLSRNLFKEDSHFVKISKFRNAKELNLFFYDVYAFDK